MGYYKIVPKYGRILRHPLFFLKSLYPFITAHHPECKYYRNHYISIFGVKLCIGCTFTLLTAIPILILFFTIGLPFIEDVIQLLVLIIILLIFEIPLKLMDKNKISVKIIRKLILGIILSFSFIVILSLRLPLIYVGSLLWLYYNILSILFIVSRIRKYQSICKKCEFYDNFPFCPGFEKQILRLERNKFTELIQK